MFAQYPLPVVSAEGVWLQHRATAAGCSICTAVMPWPRSAMAIRAGPRALTAQARTLELPEQRGADGGALRAAQRLIRFSGLDFNSVFFVNSGAEANENALKMAFTITQRAHVAAVEHAFHGRTAAAGAITWGAARKWYGFPRTPFDVSFIAAARPRRPSRSRSPSAPRPSSSSRCRASAAPSISARPFLRGAARALRCRSARC